MTCSDVMTHDPRCCYPTDSVVRAAQVMREENVGPVPVVDPDTKMLVGLVTDRDIALQVVAQGREPHAVDVQDIMSKDLITCGVNDHYDTAVESMVRHQVRRIPVVNPDGSLAGIIAQADIARYSTDSEVGHVIEEISDAPHALSAGRTTRWMPESAGNAASSLLIGAGCFTLGVCAMYLLDPDRGRTRRVRARDKALRLYHDSADFAGKVQRDLANRTSGTIAQFKGRFHQEEYIPESKLEARVRSRMGRLISHPHAIQVSARDGQIILHGDILADDVTTLLSAIRSVPGVTGIDNRLIVHDSAEGISSLQGSSERTGERWEIMKDNWSPATRVIIGAVGSLLALYGLRSRGPAAKTAGTMGLGLLARGISNTAMTSWVGSQGQRQVH